MLTLATFFPTADSVGQEGFDFFGVSITPCYPSNSSIFIDISNFYPQEFLKSTIDLADLVGILLVLNGIPGKGHAKVLTAGIGWAGAEVLLTRFLLLWVGARGAEFDWKYIQKSLESNISLVQHITTATLVWLWSRHDLRRGLVPIVVSMLLLTVYRSMILEFLTSLLLAGPWSSLFIKATTTLFMGATTLHMYAGLAHSIGIF